MQEKIVADKVLAKIIAEGMDREFGDGDCSWDQLSKKEREAFLRIAQAIKGVIYQGHKMNERR